MRFELLSKAHEGKLYSKLDGWPLSFAAAILEVAWKYEI